MPGKDGRGPDGKGPKKNNRGIPTPKRRGDQNRGRGRGQGNNGQGQGKGYLGTKW